MVLSNKKMKQKIRAELAESLSAVAVVSNSESNPNSQSQSLKELLDSACHKPRLSKREKRRKLQISTGLDGSDAGISEKKGVEVVDDGENGKSDQTDKKKKKERTKKRKRDNAEGDGLGEKAEDGEESNKKKENDNSNKKKKKKKKHKKKRKTDKTPKKAGDDNAEEKVEKEEPKIEQIPDHRDSPEDGIVPRKVYVGGIPYHYTEEEISNYFRTCGSIAKIDCKLRPEDGEFSGIAFITFETEEAANRALALDRAAMGDCFLTIQQYTKTPSRRTSGFTPELVDGYNRVYIGNLAWDTTERDIRKLFSDCVITSVRLGKNKETGEFRGYAHVDFKDSVSMVIALKLNQAIVCGRPVKISCAVPKKAEATDPAPVEATKKDDYYEKEETYEVKPEAASDVWMRPEVVRDEVKDMVVEVAPAAAAPVVSSGKIRRRTCYECGEKGHLSSACPKKLQNAT